jgi:hypothetical protein
MIGTCEQIAGALYAHAGFREVTEVAFSLRFGDEDYAAQVGATCRASGPRGR